MMHTIIIALAAFHFVVVACFVNAHDFINVVIFKVYSITLAFFLGVVAVARFMGWPI